MIHSVYTETFVQPTEDKNKVKRAFEFVTGKKGKEEEIEEFFEQKIIKIYSIIKRKKEIEALLEKIGKLDDIEKRSDDKGNFYVRFDKGKAFNEELKITDKGYAIKLKFKFVSFPKDVEKIQNEIKETFS